MTVKELIAVLQEQDGDRLVVMSKDGGGNDFSPLANFGLNSYVPSSTYSGEVYPEEITQDMIDTGWSQV